MSTERTKVLLLVDDQPDIREVGRLSLEVSVGWHILLAASGHECIEVAKEQQPDAIILDVMMPGMDGVATLEALRREPTTAHIPVLFLTAKVQAADQERFLKLGVAGILSKPFRPRNFAGDIQRLLGWDEGSSGQR